MYSFAGKVLVKLQQCIVVLQRHCSFILHVSTLYTSSQYCSCTLSRTLSLFISQNILENMGGF